MRTLVPVLFALAVSVATAQPSAEPPAAARFHEGARLYVDGRLDAAAQAVDAGLAEAPADARLRALRELIRQQQGGGGDAPEPPPPSGDGETEPPPSDGPPDDAPPDNGPPDEPDGDTPGPPPGSGEAPGPEAPAPSGMSRAEAEALLDAVGGEERLLLRDLRRRPSSAARPERDW